MDRIPSKRCYRKIVCAECMFAQSVDACRTARILVHTHAHRTTIVDRWIDFGRRDTAIDIVCHAFIVATLSSTEYVILPVKMHKFIYSCAWVRRANVCVLAPVHSPDIIRDKIRRGEYVAHLCCRRGRNDKSENAENADGDAEWMDARDVTALYRLVRTNCTVGVFIWF